jgi:CRISPR-associated protein Csd1
MILARLKEYADTQMKLPPEMYKGTAVRWFVNITPEGQLDSITPVGGDEANKNGIEMIVPYQGNRTSTAIRPSLLADTGEYALGVQRKKGGNPERVLKHARKVQRVGRNMCPRNARINR